MEVPYCTWLFPSEEVFGVATTEAWVAASVGVVRQAFESNDQEGSNVQSILRAISALNLKQ